MKQAIFDVTATPLQRSVTQIEASAGTGKTFSLAGIILRLIIEEHLPLREILAVTFTIAATAELKERVRRRLSDALDQLRGGQPSDPIVARVLASGDVVRTTGELQLALESFDEAQVFTIHSFCQRTLQDYAFETGTTFDTELVTDTTSLFEQLVADFWRIKICQASPLVAALTLAWGKSPAEWTKLLDRLRNHPDVVVLPSANKKSSDDLGIALAADLQKLRAEWEKNGPEVQRILTQHSNLKPTFRSECALKMPALAQACGAFDDADPVCLVTFKDFANDKLAGSTKKNQTPPGHRFFDLSTTFCARIEELFLQLTRELLQYAENELPKRKARTNVVTFDDLILRLRGALRSPGGDRLANAVAEKYKAVLVDEFQDTDPAQYEIFHRIFGGGSHYLYYIGDPKQAIYGFRGADIFTYLAAAQSEHHHHRLDTNRRSEPPLVDAVNLLFGQTSQPFVLPGIRYEKVRADDRPQFSLLTGGGGEAVTPLRFIAVPSTNEGKPMSVTDSTTSVCHAVSSEIARLMGSGALLGDRPLGLGDVAILVRLNKQAEQLQDVLRAAGIRSIVQSDRTVFQSRAALQLQQLLQGIIAPQRDRLVKAALLTDLIGLNGDDLAEFEAEEGKRQRWLDRFAEWRRRWMDECFIAMFRQLVVELDLRARVVKLEAGERQLTDLLHLAELLHSAETTQRLSADGLVGWLRRQRGHKHVAQEEFQLRLESDSNAVQIVTIHKCKGLEYPMVFCPFFWGEADWSGKDELLFHDREHDNQLTVDLRGKSAATSEQLGWASEENSSEEARMLYVAITRAKNRCIIHVPAYKELAKSKLALLFDVDARGDLPGCLERLAAGSNGCISLALAESAPANGRSRVTRPPKLAARKFSGQIDRTAMVASFSGLNTGRIEVEEEEPEVSDTALPLADEPERTGTAIADFARGRRAGDFFHAVLERLDFTGPELEPLVDEQLRWHGLAGTPAREAVLATLRDLLAIELEPGVTLGRLEKPNRIAELEFTFRLNRLEPARLREVFSKCPGVAPEFRKSLGRLRFDPVEGYLRGFIDLFFEAGGRYYVVDWKSNWLGPQPEDYTVARMTEAMLEHNYFLQAHLYALAADLHLQTRQPGYNYGRDFGGVLYVFLRGLRPGNSSLGIFRQRPDEKTMIALRTLAT